MIRRVIVTGASGFLGGWAAVLLPERGYTVLALGGKRPVPPEVTAPSRSCDLEDEEEFREIVRAFQPDAVVNCAALAQAEACERDSNLAHRLNAVVPEMMLSVLEAERGASSVPFIQISTDLVFDGAEAPEGGFTEDDNALPRSVYARTKSDGEERTLRASERSWVFRASLIYGSPIGGREGFLGWMRQAAVTGNPVTLFVDEFRTPIFAGDFIHVLDLFFRRANFSDSPGSRVLHVAGPQRLSRYDFGKIFAALHGYPPELFVPGRRDQSSTPHRPADVSLNIAKLNRLLSYTPHAPASGLPREGNSMRGEALCGN
jgi:dTDP-4-dehydrorhamnose reductase